MLIQALRLARILALSRPAMVFGRSAFGLKGTAERNQKSGIEMPSRLGANCYNPLERHTLQPLAKIGRNSDEAARDEVYLWSHRFDSDFSGSDAGGCTNQWSTFGQCRRLFR